MAKRHVVITEDCPCADYTKPVIDADLVSEFRIECLTLEDVQDIAAGVVPRSIQATAKQLLEMDDIERRRAQRPTKKPIKTSRAGGSRHAPQERER